MITSPNPYEAPDFDAGFMNDKRDMAPMVWGYIKSRETARRMQAYAGEVTGMHPFYAYDSEARAMDMDLATTNAYAGPNHLTSGIQHGQSIPYLFHLCSMLMSIRVLVHASDSRQGSRT